MQYHLGQRATDASWLVGEGVLVDGLALRCLAAPGTAFDGDQQVAHMKNLVRTAEDHGGVHANSGIPAHAFYLTALALGGYAWDPAGRIWLSAVHDKRLRPTSGFSAFAGCTVLAARRLHGDDSPELAAITESWQAVGVRIPRTALDPAG
jgi:Zn-dependent metalloprotease